MRVFGIREAKAGFSGLVSAAQKKPVIITHHGKPVAIVIGVGDRFAKAVQLLQKVFKFKLPE